MESHKWEMPPDGLTEIDGISVRIEVCVNGCGAIRKSVWMDGALDWVVVHCQPNPIPDHCNAGQFVPDYSDWIYPKPHDPIREAFG